MAYELSCNHCAARFSLSADLYARRVKGSISTIRCRHCNQDFIVDDTNHAAGSANLQRHVGAGSAPKLEPISERVISQTGPVVPVASPAAKPQPPPVPRKSPEKS